MSTLAAIAALALLPACVRDNPLFTIAESDSGSSSNSSTSAADTASATTVSSDSVGPSSDSLGGTSGSTSSTSSGASTSTGGESSSSTGAKRSECPYVIDDAVVAYYRFEDPQQLWVDEAGSHDGELVSGGPSSVPGPRGCGNALGVTDDAAGRVADAPAFDLVEGSVDLWVRAPDTDLTVPLLSRDANGAASEHLTLFLSSVVTDAGVSPGHLVVRHQSEDAGAAVCSEEPLPPGAWVHVAYNFGPPGMELYIDGVLQVSTDVPDVPGGGIPACDGQSNAAPVPFEGGLLAPLPWFIAASAQSEAKGAGQTPSEFMGGGALDEIRISGMRREFSEL